jgi:hypothetical protein
VKKQIPLEIAHDLFIDIVVYSKFSINEQRAVGDYLCCLSSSKDMSKNGPEPTGLEPATSAVTGRRSNQLS